MLAIYVENSLVMKFLGSLESRAISSALVCLMLCFPDSLQLKQFRIIRNDS